MARISFALAAAFVALSSVGCSSAWMSREEHERETAQLREYKDALEAENAGLRLKGADGETYADFGEMLVLANAGLVPKEATQAFAEALKLDARSPKARFYGGLALKQDGKRAEALALWQGLLADTGPQDSWRPALEAQIASLSPGSATRRSEEEPRWT